MVNKITALFMALLIGNPMCCCAIVDLLAVEGDDSPPIHSCCMAEENVCDEGNDREPDSCPCFLKKEQIAPETQSAFLKLSHKDADSASVSVTDCATHLPNLSLAVSHICKWPPGSLPTLSLSERLALQSSYLL